MGAETLLIAGATAYAAKEQRKARKNAEKSANESTAQYEAQRSEVAKERGLMNAKLDNSKKKLAVGMARSNRARSRGGIFGDTGVANQSPLSSSLG